MEKWPRRVAGVEGCGGGAPRCLDHLVEGIGGRDGKGPQGPATAGVPAGKEGSQREYANTCPPPPPAVAGTYRRVVTYWVGEPPPGSQL